MEKSSLELAVVKAVASAYAEIGLNGSKPPAGIDFPTGEGLALHLGYPPGKVGQLPKSSLEGFVGAAPLPAEILAAGGGGVVLDCGAGAGVDSLWLASEGVEVVALEGVAQMLQRLQEAKRVFAPFLKAPLYPLRGWLPHLPLCDRLVSWVTMNGVANLVADKALLCREIHRVLMPGGKLLLADVIALQEVDVEIRESPEAWAFCVGGALTGAEWRENLSLAGFKEIEVELLETFPPLGRGIVRARK